MHISTFYCNIRFNFHFKCGLKIFCEEQTYFSGWNRARLKSIATRCYGGNFTFMWPCIVTNFFIIKNQLDALISQIYFGMKLYKFRAVPLPIIRSLFTVCSARDMSYRFQNTWKAIFKHVWHIPVPSVQWINSWWWAEELPETCRISCQNKFGKLVHLVGFLLQRRWKYLLFQRQWRTHEFCSGTGFNKFSWG